jgi:dihydroflavonol-4-reductase
MVRREPKWLSGLDVEDVRCDLADHAALCTALDGSDYVFHVAGLTRAPSRAELFVANVDGTATLLEAVRQAAPGVRRVVVMSSQAAAGPSPVEDGRVRPLTEQDPLRPISEYGESKAAMERVIAERFGDLPITIVRPPAVYGPREADIYTVIRAASKLRIFPIVGSGRQPQLSLVHVRDLVTGTIDAAEAKATVGETFFIGSERGYSWNEIRDAVRTALDKRLLTVRVPVPVVVPVGTVFERVASLVKRYPPLNREKAREATHAWVSSIEKAHSAFGYRDGVPLMEGMTETVAWYRKEGWL